MKTFEKLKQWSDRNNFFLFDLLRICLGGILILKGISFGQNQNDIEIIVDNGPFNFISLLIVQYIVITHIAGGFLILIGLITRTSVLFLLPVVAGAVVLSPLVPSLAFYQNETLALLILFLLISFLIYGSGAFSADRYLKHHPNS
jgi:putative oxidoreductase